MCALGVLAQVLGTSEVSGARMKGRLPLPQLTIAVI